MKDKTTAALLAFFLGGIGVHRFYLNQIGLGFLYLLLSWTFVPLIISFIDFIVFLSMDLKTFNYKYNKNHSFQVNNLQNNSSDEIEKLYNLKEKGIITQVEFDRKKKELL
ncbi:NINE protein [Flavobacteriaceae bacterium 14752]|uniref:NINE protein n=1 Tax=Mesohalobacter salilacus TaxID=2491711 RepID=UPI000F63DC15|nr:NINE protein [Flavobacteriaceae bacterium 14752]